MKSIILYCRYCSKTFEPERKWQLYCSDQCRVDFNNSLTKKTDIQKTRYCKVCGKSFIIGFQQMNKQHCSLECSQKSARISRTKFWSNQIDKKSKRDLYYKKSKEKCGPDGNLKRYYLRYPDAPRNCQSCGENRVLDIAHKPGFERNGSWRSVSNCTPEKVWILCPTCHALLDRMNYSPNELGL